MDRQDLIQFVDHVIGRARREPKKLVAVVLGEDGPIRTSPRRLGALPLVGMYDHQARPEWVAGDLHAAGVRADDADVMPEPRGHKGSAP